MRRICKDGQQGHKYDKTVWHFLNTVWQIVRGTTGWLRARVLEQDCLWWNPESVCNSCVALGKLFNPSVLRSLIHKVWRVINQTCHLGLSFIIKWMNTKHVEQCLAYYRKWVLGIIIIIQHSEWKKSQAGHLMTAYPYCRGKKEKWDSRRQRTAPFPFSYFCLRQLKTIPFTPLPQTVFLLPPSPSNHPNIN